MKTEIPRAAERFPVSRKIFIAVILSAARVPRSGISASRRIPKGVSPAMLIQGVLLRDRPRKRISRPQFSAKSSQRGFIFSISTIFFLDASLSTAFPGG